MQRQEGIPWPSFGGVPIRRTVFILALVALCVVGASPAEGGDARASACGVQAFSYAGLQASSAADGVSATLDATAAPSVADGHVGGWIGVGGTSAGPGGIAEWLQAGLAAFAGDQTMELYYEVTVAGSQPKYVELDSSVATGVSHHITLLEIAHRKSWWRVWVDGQAVSPPIDLPGSDGTWYPQAVAENWNGGAGACNAYAYRFSNVTFATVDTRSWRPLQIGYEFHDPGYAVVPISSVPRSFVATSLNI
jgi:hypothetical protein